MVEIYSNEGWSKGGRGSKVELFSIPIIALLPVSTVSLLVAPTSATVSRPKEPQSQLNLIGSTQVKKKWRFIKRRLEVEDR